MTFQNITAQNPTSIGQIVVNIFDEPNMPSGAQIDSGSVFDLPISLQANDLDLGSVSVMQPFTDEPPTLIENVDYTIDYPTGFITFLSSGSALVDTVYIVSFTHLRRSAGYQIAILDQNLGEISKRTGELNQHLTAAQKSGIATLLEQIRQKATDEILTQ